MKVKKFLSVVIIVSILLNVFVLMSYAETTDSSVSASDFFEQTQKFADEHKPGALSADDLSDLPLNRLIVKTKNNIALKETYSAVDVIEGYNGLHILQYRSESDTENAYVNFFMDENIEFVDYDSWVCSNGSLGKCYCNSIMGLTECGCLSTETQNLYCTCIDTTSGTHLSWNSVTAEVDRAYEYLNSKNIEYNDVTVAVFDTGLFVNHKEFDPNRITLDEDYQILIDGEYRDSSEDFHYHGTHVAGTIYDNTFSSVKICPYRVFADTTYKLEYSVFCMALNAAIENGVDVINMSIQIVSYEKYLVVQEDGTIVESTENDPNAKDATDFMYEIMDKAIDNRIVIVVAAGNKKKDVSLYPLTSFEDAIVVAATTRSNSPDNSYTNKGTGIDIAAPGTDIYSTVPWVPKNTDEAVPPSESLYMRISGTSMAAPLVSAAAALLKSINPEITPAEVERIIKETAYVPEGWDKANYGEGIINFYNMVVAAVSEKPEFRFTADGKIKIVAPNNPDADIYYSLDYTVPTIEEKLVYSEPLVITDPSVKAITAVCHENGKLISEPVVYKLTQYFNLTVERFQTERPMSGGENMNITWRSFDPDIAKVDQNGNITGVSVGETQVYAIFDSGLRITYVVTVEPPWWQQLLRWLFFGFIWYRIC